MATYVCTLDIFIDYYFLSGPNKYDEACAYIEQQFQSVVEGVGTPAAKTIYTHFTNATDTENVDRVFESCMDVVFKNSMEKVGFM